MLITTVGAFAAFSLMTIAVGTDYWLYSRGVCRTKSTSDNETSRKNEEVMTHSGLWRTCCLEGIYKFLSMALNYPASDILVGVRGDGGSVGERGIVGIMVGKVQVPRLFPARLLLCGMKVLDLVDCFWCTLHVTRFCDTLGSFCS